MPNGTSERSALIEHCGVGGSVRKGTLYPIIPALTTAFSLSPMVWRRFLRSLTSVTGSLRILLKCLFVRAPLLRLGFRWSFGS